MEKITHIKNKKLHFYPIMGKLKLRVHNKKIKKWKEVIPMKLRKLMTSKGGFTLVEIMIVVAIIGLLAAIAIPNFVQARQTAQKNACISNLKQIEGAMVLYSLDGYGTATSVADLVPTYIKTTPSCPAGGTYDVTGTRPTCTESGHTLP